MTRRIRRSLAARRDVLEIVDHIATENPSAAYRFAEAVRATEQVLLASPLIGARREYKNPALKGMRMHPVTEFRTYLIFPPN